MVTLTLPTDIIKHSRFDTTSQDTGIYDVTQYITKRVDPLSTNVNRKIWRRYVTKSGRAVRDNTRVVNSITEVSTNENIN